MNFKGYVKPFNSNFVALTFKRNKECPKQKKKKLTHTSKNTNKKI